MKWNIKSMSWPTCRISGSLGSLLSLPADIRHKQRWSIASVNVAARRKSVRSWWSWNVLTAPRPSTSTRWSMSASVSQQSVRFSPHLVHDAGDADPRTGSNRLWTQPLTFSHCISNQICVTTTHYSAVYFLKMITSWMIIIKNFISAT